MKNKIFTALAVVGGITVALSLFPQRLLAVIGAPAEIFNLVSHWIPVRDVDQPARAYVNPHLPGSTVHASFALTTVYTVPAGKTFVIESVSGHCDAPQGIGYAYLVVKEGNNYNNEFYPGSVSHANSARWSFHALTRFYAAEGAVLSIGFQGPADNIMQTMFCVPSISGYLVGTNWNNDPSSVGIGR